MTPVEQVGSDQWQTVFQHLADISPEETSAADVERILTVQNWPIKIDAASIQKYYEFLKARKPQEVIGDVRLLTLGAGGDYKAQLVFTNLAELSLKPSHWNEAIHFGHDISIGTKINPIHRLMTILTMNEIGSKSRIDREALAKQVKNVLEIFGQFYPQLQKLFREDIGRLLQRNNISRPDFIPEASEGRYENPFQLKLFAENPHSFSYAYSPSGDLDFSHLNALEQCYAYFQTVTLNFENNVLRPLTIARDHHGAAQRTWNARSSMYPETPYTLRILEFAATLSRLKTTDRKSFMKDFLQRCLKEDPQGTFIYDFLFNIQGEYSGTIFRGLLVEILQEEDSIRKHFYKIVRDTSAPNATTLLRLFTGLPREKNLSACLPMIQEVVNALVQNAEDASSEVVATKLFIYVSNFSSAESEKIGSRLVTDAIIRNPFVFNRLLAGPLPSFDDPQKVSDWIDNAQKNIYLLSVLDKENISAAIKSLVPRKQEVNFKNVLLDESQLPQAFDEKTALKKIQNAKSWAPPEPRLLVGVDGMPGDLQIFIEPHPKYKNVDAWRIRFHFIGIRQSKIRKGEATADFSGGKLESTSLQGFSGLQKLELEKIGIYLAYEFFVRHPELVTTKVIRHQIGRAAPGTLTFPYLENEPVKTAGPRAERDLALDAREGVQQAMAVQTGNIRGVIEESLRALQAVLSTEGHEIQLDKLLLYKRQKGLVAGEYIYERVPEDEVKAHLEQGDLTKADYYVLIRPPYMQATGYYHFDRKVELEPNKLSIFRRHTRSDAENFDYEKVDKDEVQKLFDNGTLTTSGLYVLIGPPYMKKTDYYPLTPEILQQDKKTLMGIGQRHRTENAELAYMYYANSGLPELSNFRSFDTTLGILVDDPDFSKDGIAQFNTGASSEVYETKKLGTNSQLVMKMRDPSYLESWHETQKRILEEEIREIDHSHLSAEEKAKAIAERKGKIEALPELIEKMRKGSQIIVSPDGKGTVRLCLGWMETETTFNAGKFVHMSNITFPPSYKAKYPSQK